MKPMPYTPVIVCDEGALGSFFFRGDPREMRISQMVFVEQELARKRLSDAECAAEYWAVSHAVEVNMKHGDALKDLVAQQIKEQHAWHRFATTPHAFRGDSNG